MDLEGPVNVQKLHNAVQLIQQCRDVSESCKLSPYKVVSFNVQLMCAKSSQHAAFLRSSSFIRPVVAGCRHAHLTRISMCRATGGEARSQRDNDRGEADAKHGERLSAGADDYIVNPKHEVSNEEDVSDMRQSSGGGASDASVQAATVQVCDSQKKSRAERHAEDAVLDVTYEVLDEGIPHQGQQIMHRESLISGVEPGDPYEEGWVADTANDARARHWQTEESQYKPVSWSALGLNFGSFDVVSSEGGDGRGDGAHGGGGNGRGSGYVPRAAYGDGGGSSAAVAIVYAFLVAVLGYFWWSIYIVVSKPELIGKKVSTFWSSQRWRAKLLQRHKEVKIPPRKETRYRTLCVYRQGYSRLARRLIAPSPAVDAALLDHTLERDGGYSSMFLEVPRPSVSAHPVRLRRISRGPRLVKSRAHTSMSRDFASSLQLDVPLPMNPEAATDWPSRLPMTTGTPAISDGMHIMPVIGYSPFEGRAGSATLTAELSLRRAMGSLPSSETLDAIFNSMPSTSYHAIHTSFRHRRLSRAGPSVHGSAPVASSTRNVFSRHVTLSRYGEGLEHIPSEDMADSQLTSHEYHDLQRHFVSHVVPGSLALNTLQRHSAHARQEPSFPFEHAGRGEAASAMKRNKSQPAMSVDEPRVPSNEAVRRSASLHSLADAKTSIKAGEGAQCHSKSNALSGDDT